MKFQLFGMACALIYATFSGPVQSAATKPNMPEMLQKPSEFAAAIQDLGYMATISKLDDGDPQITSSSGGSRFIIMFSECEANEKCQLISFYKGFTYPQKDYAKYKPVSDRWNGMFWISKTAVGEDTIHFAYSYDISGKGVTSENFQAVFERWAYEMDKLKNEFDRSQ